MAHTVSRITFVVSETYIRKNQFKKTNKKSLINIAISDISSCTFG